MTGVLKELLENSIEARYREVIKCTQRFVLLVTQ